MNQGVTNPCADLVGHTLYDFRQPSASYQEMHQTSQRAATKGLPVIYI